MASKQDVHGQGTWSGVTMTRLRAPREKKFHPPFFLRSFSHSRNSDTCSQIGTEPIQTDCWRLTRSAPQDVGPPTLWPWMRLRVELAEHKADMKADIANLHKEISGIYRQISSQTKWMLTGLAMAVVLYPIITRLVARLLP